MHPTLVLRRWLLVLLIVAAVAAPGVSGAQRAQSSRTVDPRSPVVVEVRRGGFHWSDAGVGAAAALAVVAIAAGVALVLRGRHDRPSAQDTS